MRKIHGISEELMIAAGNEDGFYVYAADESTAPDTLGKLLELYGLSQNIELNYVTKCENYEEKEELLLDNDDEIWQILAGRSDAKLDNTSDFFERENRIYLAFTATSETLGVYNRVIYISEDGYFATNILDYEYSYFIGKRSSRTNHPLRTKAFHGNKIQQQCANHIRNCHGNWKWIYDS